MQAHDETRIRFEAAVVERLKESGFLEIEIRTECLVRVDDGYQDEVINAAWHYWQAAIVAVITEAKELAKTEAALFTPSPQWLPIAKADRSITQVQEFPSAGITLRNSDRYWVRDDLGGLPYEASWSEGRNGQSYWWAWEAESPVNPSEFMPHPLDPRYRETADKDQDIEKCPICDAPFRLTALLAHDIELGACHAECLKGSPVVDLDTGEETGGEITTFRHGDRDNA